ncbi:MAG: ABC transporter ATP-binding protein [Actinobacteria bacterium]|nr:ABC transporter ATP-binding protein [Actinomycetota bacterium]
MASHVRPAAARSEGDASGGPDALVVARGLTKRFGELTAVDAIDFDVHTGEVFGFLGPNGAGKTSTMRMIGAVSPLTGGTLQVLDRDPATDGAEIRARLGVVPQENTVDEELSVTDNLYIYGRYFGMPRAQVRRRIPELLEFAQLTDRADDKVTVLSGGMKRRLVIARALINTPSMVLLDEPTTGLDPQARHLVWDRLHELTRQGVTLLLTTHYMDEAEQLCDRLVVMSDATIVAEGSPRELIATYAGREVLEVRFPPGHRYAGWTGLDGIGSRREVLADRVIIYGDDAEQLTSAVTHSGVEVASMLVRRASLEDVFLRLTGRRLIE